MAAPTIDRRAFLAGSAAVVGAGAGMLTGCTNGSARSSSPTEQPVDSVAGSASPPDTDLSSWEAVRAEFELDPELAHFAAFILATHPAGVRRAIDEWRSALDSDAAAVLSEEIALEETVRRSAANYFGASPDEVALTESTTMGLGLTYHGLRLSPGDHVLTTTHDFYSTHESLRLAAGRFGAEVQQIALYDDPATASEETMAERIGAAIRPSTRVVALTWVHSGTGVKIPVRRIADVVAAANEGRRPADRALLCLDAVHGLGAEEVVLPDLGCDVFIAGTHKWLFGPRGTGVVWVRQPHGESISPIIPSFYAPSFGNWLTGGSAPSPFGLGCTPGGYKAFEHRWALADAFEFHQTIGQDRVAARTRELATRLKEGLTELPHVRLVTPRDPAVSAGIVCCEVTGRDPADVVQTLRRDHAIVAGTTPYRERLLRFGPSIVTTPEQVDAAVSALADLG